MTSELNTARLTEAQIESVHGSEQFTVPSTEQLLLYHGPELFTNVVAYSPVSHLVVAVDGRVLRVNDVFKDLTGAGDESLSGIPLTSLIAEPSRDVTDRMLNRLRSNHETAIEWVAAFLRAGRDPISLSLNAVVVRVNGRPRYITMLARSLPAVPTKPHADVADGDTYRALVERIPAITYITPMDQGNGPTYISPQVETMFGYSQAEWLARPSFWNDVLHPEDRDVVLGQIDRDRVEREGFRLEHRVITRDGRTVWVRNEAALVSQEDGTGHCWHGVIYDISERKRHEEELGHSEKRFRSLVQSTSGVVLVVERDGTILYASPSLGAWVGTSQSIVVPGSDCFDLLHRDDAARFRQFLADSTSVNGVSRDIEVRLRSAGGGWRRAEVIATNLTDDPDVQGIVLNARDVTERRDLEDLLSHQAFHDPLTDLANRALFLDRLEHALERTRRQEQIVGLLYLDIDNFKLINDNLGHEIGDQLLVAVSTRLGEAVRNVDTVARLGGDEFTILLEDLNGLGDAIQAADRIAKLLAKPFALPTTEVQISASIGIAHSGARKVSSVDLMRAADMALYRAKNMGKARYAVFERGMTAPIHERLEMEHDLRRAIDHDELEIHYQPIVDLTNGFVRGVEALVRWRHPDRGLLLPEEFVAISETSGMIVELGQHGAPGELSPGQAMAGARSDHPTALARSEPLDLPDSTPFDRGRYCARAARDRSRARFSDSRDHRIALHGKLRAGGRRPARAQAIGGAALHRRLRNRLLVVVLPQTLPSGRHQDRLLADRRAGTGRPKSAASRRDHRRRSGAGAQYHRRGNRNHRSAWRTAGSGQHRGPGSPFCQPRTGRGHCAPRAIPRSAPAGTGHTRPIASPVTVVSQAAAFSVSAGIDEARTIGSSARSGREPTAAAI